MSRRPTPFAGTPGISRGIGNSTRRCRDRRGTGRPHRMALFLDTFVNKIDRKGGVSVPASFRQQLAGQPFQGIVAMPSFNHRALTCGGIEWMTGVEREIAAKVTLFPEDHDDLSMAVFADAKQPPFDPE